MTEGHPNGYPLTCAEEPDGGNDLLIFSQPFFAVKSSSRQARTEYTQTPWCPLRAKPQGRHNATTAKQYNKQT